MKIVIAFFLSALVSTTQAAPDLKAWAYVDKPSTSAPRSIGKVTAGCLSGAKALPINGTGYQVMRLSRKRYYGHPDLVNFVEQLGSNVHEQKLGSMLVGDLGMARGGPTLSGHRSHQTGLDVDIWYSLMPTTHSGELSASERESRSSPTVVKSGGGLDLSQWTPANQKVLEAAARMPEVDRIFVNAYIKQQLCLSSSSHDWLQKIRPWYAHADHFHVRLKCPSGSYQCDKQEPIPAGDGCGADLAWWFSDEAKKPRLKGPSKPIVLPEVCTAVLYE